MMFNRRDSLKIVAIAIIAIEIVLILLFEFVFKIDYTFLVYVILAINSIEVLYALLVMRLDRKQNDMDITRILGSEAKEAFEYGKVGIIIYDNDLLVSWVSEYLVDNGFEMIGEKLTKVIEGIQVLFTGNQTVVVLAYKDKYYEFVKHEDGQVIYVKDVTEISELKTRYYNDTLVLGLINFDNYEETVAHEDEQTIASININIRQKMINWINGYNGVIRKLRADRFMVVCNQENFNRMLTSKFDILDTVKDAAKQLKVDITLSMTFAYGNPDIEELDSTINNLMELVLSRGGDQVAVKAYGKDVDFYGTSSETSEKNSKVRARVMAKSIDGIIKESSNVFIVPHSEADLDSLGACLGMDNIVHSIGRDTYIVFNDISVEAKTKEIYDSRSLELIEQHIFLNEEEAISLLDDNSLVIVVDHHSIDLTSCSNLINQCKKTVIIDHHRRKNEDNIPAVLIYNEPASSSTVELVAELVQYQQNDIVISPLDATIMYTGILVDTDDLRSRSSFRTFEVCAYLKKQGADIILANDWLKDSLEEFMNKTNIAQYLQVIDDDIVISAVEKQKEYLTRSELAQSANYMISIKDINAAFIIGQIDVNLFGISARSNGKINVQLILEKMGGGGHFNAAGLQRSNTSIHELKAELLNAIKEYQQGGSTNNESNTIN